MEKDHSKFFPGVRTYRFGIIAVYRKHITLDQVKHALAEQVEDNVMGRPHRRLGEILKKHGWIKEAQRESILKEMDLSDK